MCRHSAVMGLFLILFSGCGGRGSQDFIELESYGMDDFMPFQKLLIEDEFAARSAVITKAPRNREKGL